MNGPRQAGLLIARIHQVAGRLFAKKLKAYRLDTINPAQGRILFVLWQQDDIPIQELAVRTSLGKSTLTSMLDRLEQMGHVRRVPSARDRRRISIRLTEKDRQMQRVYDVVSAEMTGLFYKGFNSKEITAFEEALARVLRNVEEYEGSRRMELTRV